MVDRTGWNWCRYKTGWKWWTGRNREFRSVHRSMDSTASTDFTKSHKAKYRLWSRVYGAVWRLPLWISGVVDRVLWTCGAVDSCRLISPAACLSQQPHPTSSSVLTNRLECGSPTRLRLTRCRITREDVFARPADRRDRSQPPPQCRGGHYQRRTSAMSADARFNAVVQIECSYCHFNFRLTA